ncbi:MAG: PilZ domain-containing protein [Armatimonadetes bacterium]|nr:PilZ domain-containing protein [Armatimonadota bacterium]
MPQKNKKIITKKGILPEDSFKKSDYQEYLRSASLEILNPAYYLLEFKTLEENDPFLPLPKILEFNYQVALGKEWRKEKGELLAIHQDGIGAKILTDLGLDLNIIVYLQLNLNFQIINLIGKIVLSHPSRFSNKFLTKLIFIDLVETNRETILNYLEEAKNKYKVSAFQAESPERRKLTRLEKKVDLDYQIYQDEKWIQGKAQMYLLDISSGGIKIATDQSISSGGLLYIHFYLDHFSIYCLGKVIWVKYSKEIEKYLGGIKFLDLSSEDEKKIRLYLEEENI